MFNFIFGCPDSALLSSQGAAHWSSLFPSDTEKLAEYASSAAIISEIVYHCSSDADAVEWLRRKSEYLPWFRPIGVSTSLRNDDARITFFLVVEFESYRVVAVRGSTTATDWTEINSHVADAEFLQLMNLHAGFCSFAKQVPHELCVRWNGRIDVEKDVIFAGHSMGGVVAEICALPHLLKRTNVFVFTFGSPSLVTGQPLWVTNLSASQKSRIIRFYFEDDLVPFTTFPFGYEAFETLVRLSSTSDGRHHCQVVDSLESCMSLSQRFDSTVSKIEEQHSMARYALAIVIRDDDLNRINKNASAVKHEPSPRLVPDITTEMDAERLQLSLQSENNRIIMKLSGSGFFCSMISARLELWSSPQEKSTLRATSVSYSVASTTEIDAAQRASRVMTCYFTMSFDLTNIKLHRLSVIGGDRSHQLGFTAFNGFQQIEILLPFPACQRHVAFLGQTGHGKTKLLQALELESCNEGALHEDQFRGYLLQEDSKACSFQYGGNLFYEMPGLSDADPEYVEKVQSILMQFPPSIVVLVVKAKERFSMKGLPAVVRRLNDSKASNVRICLAVTKVPPEEVCRQEFLDLLDGLGLPEHTACFFVNSCDYHLKINGKQMVIPAQGVKELWNFLNNEVMGTPIPETVEILSVQERVFYFVKTQVTIRNVAVVGVVGALSGAAVFTPTALPFLQTLFGSANGEAAISLAAAAVISMLRPLANR